MLESQSNAQPPTWRTRVPLLVCPLPFHLSAKGDPTSSYATGGIALRVMGVPKLPYHEKMEVPTGELYHILAKLINNNIPKTYFPSTHYNNVI
jgi:hypothetical protein